MDGSKCMHGKFLFFYLDFHTKLIFSEFKRKLSEFASMEFIKIKLKYKKNLIGNSGIKKKSQKFVVLRLFCFIFTLNRPK